MIRLALASTLGVAVIAVCIRAAGTSAAPWIGVVAVAFGVWLVIVEERRKA